MYASRDHLKHLLLLGSAYCALGLALYSPPARAIKTTRASLVWLLFYVRVACLPRLRFGNLGMITTAFTVDT